MEVPKSVIETIVRIRPLLDSERRCGYTPVVSVNHDVGQVQVSEPASAHHHHHNHGGRRGSFQGSSAGEGASRNFKFDKILDESTKGIVSPRPPDPADDPYSSESSADEQEAAPPPGAKAAASQHELYDSVGPTLVKRVLANKNSSVVVVGAAGAGKSHTLHDAMKQRNVDWRNAFYQPSYATDSVDIKW